jgi:hypothetical protein
MYHQRNQLLCSFRIPSGTEFVYFAGLICGAAVFFFLAFFLFLPMLVIAPGKFALSFTCGSICTMAAMMMLSGWKAGLNHMISPERLSFTVIYLGSMAATLYAAVSMRSYVLSLGFSVVQVRPPGQKLQGPARSICVLLLDCSILNLALWASNCAHRSSERGGHVDIAPVCAPGGENIIDAAVKLHRQCRQACIWLLVE